jgi:ABC-type multidrug transport system fused ATPase/permease subunit
MQAVFIWASKVSTRTYTLGIYSAVSSSILFCVLFLQDAFLSQRKEDLGSTAVFVLRVLEMVLVVASAFLSTCLPRRPTVYFEGQPVDGGMTASALSKYSFTWSWPLLALALKKGTLDMEDLPRPDHTVRAEDVTRTWLDANRSGKLWVKIALAHKWALALQWLLTLFQAFGNFAPQYVLLKLLQLLENRDPDAAVSSEAWVWVVALGISTVAASWVESWMFWISQAELTIPVRAELSSLVFQKAMRRKDVKGVSKKVADDDDIAALNEAILTANSATEGNQPPTAKPDPDDSEEALTKQTTINLIAVDARRIGDFMSYNNYFPGTVFKLVVSFAFLLTLVGWQSLLAGFTVWALTLPVNIYFSKRYAGAQGRLMKVRDEKLGVVTEALQGLRQIKFMGIEKQWQAKIMGVRERELAEVWEADKADTMLLFCWISSPILFSAASLAVYALVYGQLTPSVAFTSIGVFKQLEVSIALNTL